VEDPNGTEERGWPEGGELRRELSLTMDTVENGRCRSRVDRDPEAEEDRKGNRPAATIRTTAEGFR
jgi:hypothetical protein